MGALVRTLLGAFSVPFRLIDFLIGGRSGLYKARFAGMSEVAALQEEKPNAPALLVGEGRFGDMLKVTETPENPELGNLMAVAPTRGARGS